MHCAVVWVETSKQKQFETALDVVFAQLELCLDFVDFLVFENCLFKRVQVKGDLWIVKSEFSDAPEEACLQNHFDVESVFHALKVLSGVLNRHYLALFVFDIVLVNDAE